MTRPQRLLAGAIAIQIAKRALPEPESTEFSRRADLLVRRIEEELDREVEAILKAQGEAPTVPHGPEIN